MSRSLLVFFLNLVTGEAPGASLTELLLKCSPLLLPFSFQVQLILVGFCQRRPGILKTHCFDLVAGDKCHDIADHFNYVGSGCHKWLEPSRWRSRMNRSNSMSRSLLVFFLNLVTGELKLLARHWAAVVACSTSGGGGGGHSSVGEGGVSGQSWSNGGGRFGSSYAGRNGTRGSHRSSGNQNIRRAFSEFRNTHRSKASSSPQPGPLTGTPPGSAPDAIGGSARCIAPEPYTIFHLPCKIELFLVLKVDLFLMALLC
ncbi:hypothetical protein DY000_02042267 [Brassica cretica]|uniref:Secreted protein n=1 Tax=Brassica cretica TaxID=69181 RepID=A0ABQ7BMU1_BRACR|nr:hypothetical protein DY000_02042267 [Brassica cretica]